MTTKKGQRFRRTGAKRSALALEQNRTQVLIGQIVTDSCALLNEFKKVAGVRISVSTGSMWFAVLGDESDVYWAQPIGFTELKSND